MKTLMFITVISLALMVAGCATTAVDEKKVVVEKKYGPDGTMVSKTYSENDKILYDLKRILEKETVRGKGKFKHETESMARVAATNLAINDLAAKAGEIIASQDVTLYNDKVYSVMRTEGRNIVKGYDVVYEKWDQDKQEYEIIIEMRGYKIAEEIVKKIK